jgi:hypothetical protein
MKAQNPLDLSQKYVKSLEIAMMSPFFNVNFLVKLAQRALYLKQI